MGAWDDCTGVTCNGCQQEVFQLIDGKCRGCHKKRHEVSEKKLERRAVERGLRAQLKEAQKLARRS